MPSSFFYWSKLCDGKVSTDLLSLLVRSSLLFTFEFIAFNSGKMEGLNFIWVFTPGSIYESLSYPDLFNYVIIVISVGDGWSDFEFFANDSDSIESNVTCFKILGSC